MCRLWTTRCCYFSPRQGHTEQRMWLEEKTEHSSLDFLSLKCLGTIMGEMHYSKLDMLFGNKDTSWGVGTYLKVVGKGDF